MKIAFIILNYNTHIETTECISSIKEKIDTDDFKILIVDNASEEEDYSLLMRKYKNDNKVEIIRNDHNIGFANGNNAGIEFANSHWNPEFVAVINSDTELIQRDLIRKLDSEYAHSGFALLGPLVLNADGRCDNSPHFDPTVEGITEELRHFRKEKGYIVLGLYRPYCGLRKLREIIYSRGFHHTKTIHRNRDFHVYQQNVVLQGCFLIFSRKAFKYIDGFDKRTFLYYEEPLLFLELKKNNLTTVYDPEICIYHKDGASVNKIGKTSKQKLLFINKCYIESAEIILKELQNGE